MQTPTPIYSLPFFSIDQMRAVAGVLRGYIDGNAPDTNEGEDWNPPADLAEVSAAVCHLDAAIESHGKPAQVTEIDDGPQTDGCGWVRCGKCNARLATYEPCEEC